MPLVWAHAEHMKLLRSLSDGKVFDMPAHTKRRYLEDKQQARCRPWRPDCQVAALPVGRALRLDLPEPSIVRFTRDGWATYEEAATRDTALGLHVADIATTDMVDGKSLIFTWRNAATGAWQGVNHEVRVVG